MRGRSFYFKIGSLELKSYLLIREVKMLEMNRVLVEGGSAKSRELEKKPTVEKKEIASGAHRLESGLLTGMIAALIAFVARLHG